MLKRSTGPLPCRPDANVGNFSEGEIGCLERTLFILDWISDPALRRRAQQGRGQKLARPRPVLSSWMRHLALADERSRYENSAFGARVCSRFVRRTWRSSPCSALHLFADLPHSFFCPASHIRHLHKVLLASREIYWPAAPEGISYNNVKRSTSFGRSIEDFLTVQIPMGCRGINPHTKDMPPLRNIRSDCPFATAGVGFVIVPIGVYYRVIDRIAFKKIILDILRCDARITVKGHTWPKT